MMHDEWTARLSEYVDGELGADDRVRLESHLATCDDCAVAVAELRQVVAAARTVPVHEPPASQWSAIAERLDGGAAATLRPGRRRFTFTVSQLAAAALAVVVASGGAVWLAMRTMDAASPAPVADAAAAPDAALVSFDPSAYQATIGELEAALAATREQLAPETVAAVEHALAAIDAAIAEAVEALRADPNDPFLVRHLERTMVKKMDILKRAMPKAPAQT